MTKDAQAITAAIVIMGFIIALTLERVARALEKLNSKPIGKSDEANELNNIAHFLMQIRDSMKGYKHSELYDPVKMEQIKKDFQATAANICESQDESLKQASAALNRLKNMK